jgi:UDP-hydrolysing UDP-N-acetyl-D-glucosamine 2-epimerase
MRTIAVFTGTRAEYGLLKSVMQGIMRHDGCSLHTIVSGSHLGAKHGQTLDEIHADGIPVHDCAEMLLSSDSPAGVSAAMGIGLIRYADILARVRPDILVLLGDRFEALAMASAATLCGVPIAHIHGGEVTEGAIDDAFRHAITKMSHLHFTSCEAHRQRVIQLGEHPDRVFNVGSLGVEAIQTLDFIPEDELRRDLQINASVPYVLCTFHPVTLEAGQEMAQLDALLQALDTFPEYVVVFTGANADPGGNRINETLVKRAACDGRYRFFMSLGQRRYLSAAKHAACVIGNSSSGIIEVPSLGVPVVDIGNRQKGRIRTESVLHCEPESRVISDSLTNGAWG